MKNNGKIVRKTLDLLIKSADTFEKIRDLKFMIDDYIEEGYFVKQQIADYNEKVNKFYAKRN